MRISDWSSDVCSSDLVSICQRGRNPMHRERNVKIVATLGPASAAPDRIRALFAAGADVFRLNFSHGSHDDHLATLRAVRALEHELGRPIGLLADLQGPKLRVGRFAATDGQPGAVALVPGQRFRLDADATPGDATPVQQMGSGAWR